MADTRRAAIFIDKGGTGKTTNAAELGAALNELGKDVLLLDLAGKAGRSRRRVGCVQIRSRGYYQRG